MLTSPICCCCCCVHCIWMSAPKQIFKIPRYLHSLLSVIGWIMSRGAIVGFHLLPSTGFSGRTSIPSTRLAANLQPHPFPRAMTASKNRRSMRLSSSSNSNSNGEQSSSKVTPTKKKSTSTTAAKKSKSTTPIAQVTGVSSLGSKHDPNAEGRKPWYHIFTKGDEEYDRYMATEWGLEKHGTVTLFEKISLEGAQSGLSWLTILRKRDAYRRKFYNFDIGKVAAMTDLDVARILAEEDKANTHNIVVRHKGKVESVINNAKCIQKLQKEHPDNPDYFDEFIWSFVNHKPILNSSWHGGSLQQALAQTEESQAMSKALKKLGFRFVGPTTMYAMMQSCGLVIDHPVNSPEWIAARNRLEKRPGGYQERKSS